MKPQDDYIKAAESLPEVQKVVDIKFTYKGSEPQYSKGWLLEGGQFFSVKGKFLTIFEVEWKDALPEYTEPPLLQPGMITASYHAYPVRIFSEKAYKQLLARHEAEKLNEYQRGLRDGWKRMKEKAIKHLDKIKGML